jgi:hypothetical protein
MKITQISIFLENKQGRLSQVCALLGSHGINIRALTIAENDEFGILRLVVDKAEEAVRMLKDNGLVAQMTDIVALEVDDTPGGLAAILKVFSENGLNVEYMYGFVEKKTDKALMVFRFDDTDAALKILSEKGLRIVSKDDIVNL